MIHSNESNVTDLSSIKVVSSRASSVVNLPPKKMSILDNVIFCAALCLLAGVFNGSQGAVNAKLGVYTGQGLSSTICFVVGAVVSCIYWLIEVQGRPPTNLVLMMGKAPWWSWTGGILGAGFVIIIILAIPKLGAGTATAVIVCAQMIMSCIIDNFELFGVSYRQYSVWRLIATATLIGSVGVIAKF